MRNHQHINNRHLASKRTARAIVCIIVCMGIATTILMKSMQTALRMRRQIGHELQMEQTRWLLEATRIRAVRRLNEDPEYEGETWNVSNAFDSYDNATIDIEITSSESGSRVVTATSRIGIVENPTGMTQRSGRWTTTSNENESEE